jgi:hypothetical protein
MLFIANIFRGTSIVATRAVRFSGKEEELIQEFLDNNSIFDFSTLARTAIFKFIQNPEVKLKPIKGTSAKLLGASSADLSREEY